MKGMIFVLALIASSSALANDVDPFGFDKQAFVSTRTRAEVQDELQRARTGGEISYQLTYGDFEHKSELQLAGKSRDDVKAELANARAQGEQSYDEIDYPLTTAVSHAQQQAQAEAHG